jgi:hypothetical protein
LVGELNASAVSRSFDPLVLWHLRTPPTEISAFQQSSDVQIA